MSTYDILILGGGPGGYVAAIKARHLGAKVALIEANAIGGVCLNEGCIPTKALLKSAKVYKTILHARDYGITLQNDQVTPNWPSMLERKSKIVTRLTDGVKTLLSKNGVDVYQGYGQVVDPHHVIVNGETISAKHLIIATGAMPILPPIEGLQTAFEKGIAHHSKTLLSIPKIPNKLVIIGGGVIGIEFATLFNALGTDVTIIERLETILIQVDDDIRNAYLRILKKDGIKIITSATVNKIENHTVYYQKDSDTLQVEGDFILVSVGMKPNLSAISSLNLKTEKGAILVNDQLQTSVKDVYAIGDVIGKSMLAHAAQAMGIVAVENILGHQNRMNFHTIPSAIYGFPEIAMVGITEKIAQQQGIPYKSSKFPLLANGRSLAEGESEGFVKILYNPSNGELLGAHILAYNATELLAEATLAMDSEATIANIAQSIHLHPTVSEAIGEAALGGILKPIHIL